MSERAIRRRRRQKRQEQTNDSSVCVCVCNAKVKCKAVRETRQIESEWERARSVMSFYSSKKNEIIADERERARLGEGGRESAANDRLNRRRRRRQKNNLHMSAA